MIVSDHKATNAAEMPVVKIFHNIFPPPQLPLLERRRCSWRCKTAFPGFDLADLHCHPAPLVAKLSMSGGAKQGELRRNSVWVESQFSINYELIQYLLQTKRPPYYRNWTEKKLQVLDRQKITKLLQVLKICLHLYVCWQRRKSQG